MLSINTNLSSLIAQSSMKSSTNKLNQAIERMTTGFKINHAKDNAANYSISTNMTTKIGAYNVAEDNAAMGLDLISTAEGTLDQIEDKLQRLRALQEQANNGTYGEQSLNAINAEAYALVDEINRLYSTAEYNGLKIFGGESTPTTANTTDSEPIQTFSFARTRETITSVDFLEPVEHQVPTSVIAISSLAEGELLDFRKTYSISSVNELTKLKSLYVDSSTIDYDQSFNIILMNDIDMTSITNWSGLEIRTTDSDKVCINFDGNGYVISNLNGTTGLFTSIAHDSVISNLGLENVNVVSDGYTGALADEIFAGGKIKNCWITGTVTGTEYVGGVVGHLPNEGLRTNCILEDVVCSVNVVGTSYVGGLLGSVNVSPWELGHSTIEVTNSQYLAASDSISGVFYGGTDTNDTRATITIENSVYNNYYDSMTIPIVAGTVIPIINNVNSVEVLLSTNGGTVPPSVPIIPSNPTGPSQPSFTLPSYAPDTIMLQIGASSDWASQVGVSTKFTLLGIDDLRMIGLDLTTDYLTQIDDMLALVSEKQTHFGAVSNRLESVLEEITIQRDNLVSSRSTIRDADIAEVSSHYIQQQILQQASATLLATANQSPSIALQLI